MFPVWLRIIFACSGIIGLFLLIKSISKIIAVYDNPNSVEFSATLSENEFEIKVPGDYEIAVKRPSLFGIIPYKVSLHLVNSEDHTEIPVIQSVNLFGGRNNLSGERIAPIAEFTVDKIGKYQLTNLNAQEFKSNDKLLVTPKTGVKGVLLIFAILFSAILFIGGLVLTLLSWVKK